MGFWNRLIDVLVVLCAVFFTVAGFVFLLMPILDVAEWVPLLTSRERLEGVPDGGKALLGAIFLLAAAPMFYYVFSENARGLPPAKKTSPGSPPLPPTTR